jgi:hypothetical protein
MDYQLTTSPRYIYLDSGIRDRTDSLQSAIDSGLSTMGHSNPRGRMGSCDNLYIDREKLPLALCLAFSCRLL